MKKGILFIALAVVLLAGGMSLVAVCQAQGTAYAERSVENLAYAIK